MLGAAKVALVIIHQVSKNRAVQIKDLRPLPMKGQLSAKKDKIKILVADDHPVVRKGLQSCLAKQDRLKIVGEASDGDEALKRVKELQPDVVLMDISMPRMNGLAVTELIRKEVPKTRVSRHPQRQKPGYGPGSLARGCARYRRYRVSSRPAKRPGRSA